MLIQENICRSRPGINIKAGPSDSPGIAVTMEWALPGLTRGKTISVIKTCNVNVAEGHVFTCIVVCERVQNGNSSFVIYHYPSLEISSKMGESRIVLVSRMCPY